jgi:hypothetical protein
MERGTLAIVALGAALLVAGGLRLARLGHFTWTQAGLCLLVVPVCLVILLITDYTLHHSKIGFVMMLALLVMLGVSSPGFCVSLGLTLIGMVVTRWP